MAYQSWHISYGWRGWRSSCWPRAAGSSSTDCSGLERNSLCTSSQQYCMMRLVILVVYSYILYRPLYPSSARPQSSLQDGEGGGRKQALQQRAEIVRSKFVLHSNPRQEKRAFGLLQLGLAKGLETAWRAGRSLTSLSVRDVGHVKAADIFQLALLKKLRMGWFLMFDDFLPDEDSSNADARATMEDSDSLYHCGTSRSVRTAEVCMHAYNTGLYTCLPTCAQFRRRRTSEWASFHDHIGHS